MTRDAEAELARLRSEVAAAGDAQQQARRAEHERDAARRELDKVRASSSYRVGELVTAVGRNPVRGLMGFPAGVVRILRRRRAAESAHRARYGTSAGANAQPGSATTPANAPATGAGAAPVAGGVAGAASSLAGVNPPGGSADDPARLLTASLRWVPAPAGVPVVAAVLADGAADPVPRASVVRLPPGPAGPALLDATAPVALVVSADAGSAGGWFGLGTGAFLDRDRDLLTLVDRARAAGARSVLLTPDPGARGVPAPTPPVLAELAARFDGVVRAAELPGILAALAAPAPGAGAPSGEPAGTSTGEDA